MVGDFESLSASEGCCEEGCYQDCSSVSSQSVYSEVDFEVEYEINQIISFNYDTAIIDNQVRCSNPSL